MSGWSVRRDVGTRVPVVRRRGGERVKCDESNLKAKQPYMPVPDGALVITDTCTQAGGSTNTKLVLAVVTLASESGWTNTVTVT